MIEQEKTHRRQHCMSVSTRTAPWRPETIHARLFLNVAEVHPPRALLESRVSEASGGPRDGFQGDSEGRADKDEMIYVNSSDYLYPKLLFRTQGTGFPFFGHTVRFFFLK